MFRIRNTYIFKWKRIDTILLDIKEREKIKQAIIDMRKGNVIKIPGYDGVFGRIELIKKSEKEQEKLF